MSPLSATPALTGAGRLRRLLPLGKQGNPRLALALILVSQLMVILDASIVNVALHDMRSALHFSDAGLSWVVNAYTLTFGGLLLLGARAGDLLGRRRVFLAGIALFTLASLAGGFAQSPGELLTARAIQGVGGALASPSALALLMTMFPEARERTRAIGLYTAVSVGGAALGLIAGGMLSEWASWRWVLFVNVPIGAVLLLLGPALAETPRNTGHFDIAGAITSTIGMSAVVYGFVAAATDGWSNPRVIVSFAVGAVLLVSFALVESRAVSPITPLRLFASRSRSAAYLGRLLVVAAMMGMLFYLTLFLRGVLGYSDLRTGLAFLPVTVMVFSASQLASRYLIDRFGGYAVIMAGLTLSLTGMALLTQLSETSGYGQLLVPLIIFGFGNGLSFVPLTSAALDGVEAKDAGAASGLVNVMQQVGGAVGLAVLVTVFSSASRRAAHHVAGLSATDAANHVFVSAATDTFLVATLFLAATWLLAAIALRPRHRPAATDLITQSAPELAPALSD